MELEISALHWKIYNDTVMGGLSRSQVLPAEQGILFSGQLSLENSGGFASARVRIAESCAGATAFRLTVRGDGRRYQFRLRADESPGSIAWRSHFETDGSVQVIVLPLAQFEPVFRGRVVSHEISLEATDIRWCGFMLVDRRPGPFQLEVHAIGVLDAGHSAAGCPSAM